MESERISSNIDNGNEQRISECNLLPRAILDDASILAMCLDENSLKDDQSSSTSFNSPLSEKSDVNFGMEGSTINISHSKDIHFGPKTVKNPASSIRSASSLGSFDKSLELSNDFVLPSDPFLQLQNVGGYFNPVDNFNEHVIANATLSNNDFRNNHSIEQNKYSASRNVDISEELKPNQHLLVEVSSRLSQGEMDMKQLVNTSGESIDSMSLSSFPSKNLMCKVSKESFLPTENASIPMSAEISRSSHVQMGTQIVYNYYISELEEVSSTYSQISEYVESF